MAEAYDKRQRLKAIQAVFAGKSVSEVAVEIGVGKRTLFDWVKRAREEKRYAPKLAGRPRRSKLDEHLPFIRDLIANKPTIAISELRTKLASDRGVELSRSSLWDFLEKNGLTTEMRRAKLKTAARS